MARPHGSRGLHIGIVTPAAPGSRSGNRQTAERWSRRLRELGHRVTVADRYGGQSYDVLVALHAYRTADAAARFSASYPERPLIVALTGTDIYRFLRSDYEATYGSMARAGALVALHEVVHDDLPDTVRSKVHVIFQSARPLTRPRSPVRRRYRICVVGHLREEKDPLRAALAARRLPAASRIEIVHAGRAHDTHWAQAAYDEMANNPRYRWLGELPHWKVRRLMASSHAMVLSSRMEGGANVISEAIVAGLPVLASRIPGSVGLLGRDYPGYYTVEDTTDLAALLARTEAEPAFLAELAAQCRARSPLFTVQRERAAWNDLLTTIGVTGVDPVLV